ncbi:MAG: hypothetical protein ACKOAD_04595 [Gammaproteobacteria bacterium]
MNKKLGNKITKILKIDLESFAIKLKFNDNFIGQVSLKHIFNSPKNLAAEVLRGNLFGKCFVLEGALAWPNGLELCPDAIRHWIIEQSNKAA